MEVEAGRGAWNGPALVVFDLAGTTVEDAGQVPAAFVATLAEYGITLEAEALASVRGSSKREAIARLLPGDRARADAAYDSFRRQLTVRYAEQGVAAVSGAEDAFRFLRASGVRIALNTGFDRSTTELLLSALRWDRVADAVVCGDEVAKGRPAPDLILRAMELTATADPQAVANVGDTSLDLEAGQSAGVRWNVGVLSGAHGRDRLEKAPHTHLLNDVSELRTLWENADF